MKIVRGVASSFFFFCEKSPRILARRGRRNDSWETIEVRRKEGERKSSDRGESYFSFRLPKFKRFARTNRSSSFALGNTVYAMTRKAWGKARRFVYALYFYSVSLFFFFLSFPLFFVENIYLEIFRETNFVERSRPIAEVYSREL